MILALGWLAALVNIAAYFIHSPRKALLALAGSELLWLVFHILMAWPSAITVSGLTILRNLLGSLAPDRLMRPFIVGILLGVSALLYRESYAWYHYMPILAASVETLSVWWRAKPHLFRAGLIASELSWIVFALQVASLPNLVCALAGIIVLLYTAHKTRSPLPPL
jgi:hypothetical protein